MSEQMQMPKKESNSVVGNPFEYVGDYFTNTLKSIQEMVAGLPNAVAEALSLGKLKNGDSKSAQDAFKNGSK
jgi:hypothetical protein